MAEMLRDEDSTAKHLDTTRRHMRLCTHIAGAETLAAAIAPRRQALIDAEAETHRREEAEQDQRDRIRFVRAAGSDVVRTYSSRAQEYDRANPGADTHEVLFPLGGFSGLLDSAQGVDAETLDGLALASRSFGESHPLAALALDAESAATLIRTEEQALPDFVRARKLAEAEEELAQAALRKQYEHNYLDARKAYGALAERLFPPLSRRRRRTPPSGE